MTDLSLPNCKGLRAPGFAEGGTGESHYGRDVHISSRLQTMEGRGRFARILGERRIGWLQNAHIAGKALFANLHMMHACSCIQLMLLLAEL